MELTVLFPVKLAIPNNESKIKEFWISRNMKVPIDDNVGKNYWRRYSNKKKNPRKKINGI